MKMLHTLLAFCEGNSPVTSGFPSQRASIAQLWFFFVDILNKLLKISWVANASDIPWLLCDITVISISNGMIFWLSYLHSGIPCTARMASVSLGRGGGGGGGLGLVSDRDAVNFVKFWQKIGVEIRHFPHFCSNIGVETIQIFQTPEKGESKWWSICTNLQRVSTLPGICILWYGPLVLVSAA